MKRERPHIETSSLVFENDIDIQTAQDEGEKITFIEEEHKAKARGKVRKKLTTGALKTMAFSQAERIIDDLILTGAIQVEPTTVNKGTGTLYAAVGRKNFSLIDKVTGEVFAIRGSVKVGRNPNHAELVPEGNNTISTEHALLTDRGGALLVQDLGSTNGTFVNGKRIEPNLNIELTAGDTITFSNAQFVVSEN